MSDPYQLITNANSYELNSSGFLKRDATIASRCRARLCIRRGQWALDLEMGSRLWTIQTMKGAREKARIYIEEALQPLVKAGEIVEIKVLEYVEDPTTGKLGVNVEIVESAGEMVQLGVIPLGDQ